MSMSVSVIVIVIVLSTCANCAYEMTALVAAASCKSTEIPQSSFATHGKLTIAIRDDSET